MKNQTTRFSFLLLCLWLWLQGASALHHFEHPLHLDEDTSECLVYQCSQRPAVATVEWMVPVVLQKVLFVEWFTLPERQASRTHYTIRAPPLSLIA